MYYIECRKNVHQQGDIMSKVLLFSLLFFITASFADGFEVPGVYSQVATGSSIVEDFDGDGIKDILVESYVTVYQRGIYSYAKKQYLLYIDGWGTCQFADLDGEPGMELLFNNKIYKYNESGTGSSVK